MGDWILFPFKFQMIFNFRSSNLERVRLLTAPKVARETVAALRRGAGYVAIPRHFLPLGKIHQYGFFIYSF